MLQAYNSPSIKEHEDSSLHDVPHSTERSLAEQFVAVVGLIRRQWLVVLLVLPLMIGLAVIYLYTTAPLYEGVAKILIDTGIDTGRVNVLRQSILSENSVSSAAMDTQIEILKSENFALSVIKKLRLDQDPKFAESGGGLISAAKKLISFPFKMFHHSAPNEAKLEPEDAARIFEDRLKVVRVGSGHTSSRFGFDRPIPTVPLLLLMQWQMLSLQINWKPSIRP